MLQRTLRIHNVPDRVAEMIVLVLAISVLAKAPGILLVPLGIALFAIPILAAYSLSVVRWNLPLKALVALVALAVEAWCFALYCVVHSAHYGVPPAFVLP